MIYFYTLLLFIFIKEYQAIIKFLAVVLSFLLFFVVVISIIGSGTFITSGLLICSLVPVKPRKLTKLERESFSVSEVLQQIIVGLLLGDLNAQKQTPNSNVRLRFEQGFVHKDYIFYLYEKFSHYCLAGPKIANRLPDKRTGEIYTRITFHTFALPCFNKIYNLFYLDGKKIIPSNINELFSVYSLAHWLCDDGTFCKSTNRVRLCTESFTLVEVNLLIQTLNARWDLKCKKVARGGGYRIVIPRKSLPILQSLLKDIMPSMMLYKIGL